MGDPPDTRLLTQLSARAMFHERRGQVEEAIAAHVAVLDALEDMRAAFTGDAALDDFDGRYNRRYEPAIAFLLDIGQISPALSLIDRTRFRSGCDARSERIRFGSPMDAGAWLPNPCAPGELMVVEWLRLTQEWSISYRGGVEQPALRTLDLSDVAVAAGEHPAKQPWFGDFAVARARAQRLVDEYADVLDDHVRLTIVPHGSQWRAPWSALTHPRTSKPLHDSHEVVLLPSIRWNTIQRHVRHSDQPRPSLVIGDPTEDSEAARNEAVAVAERLACRPLLGRQATVDAVRMALASSAYRVVHYAGHGTYDGADLTGLRLHDGVLTADDLGSTGIDADLVYLASCWSGVTEFSVWNELRGFLRAALVGGTRHLVASAFPLSNRVSPVIAEAFYTQYVDTSSPDRHSPMSALRAALAKLPDAVPVETWGSLFVVGDRE